MSREVFFRLLSQNSSESGTNHLSLSFALGFAYGRLSGLIQDVLSAGSSNLCLPESFTGTAEALAGRSNRAWVRSEKLALSSN